jgi:hypothetical protein
MSSLSDLAQATKDFADTQIMGAPFDLKAGEIEVPSSAHGHVPTGAGNSYVLLHDDSNFQLFRSADPVLTFIYSNNNSAAYWGGAGAQTIYDFGHGNTLRFSELENTSVNVYGFDRDTIGKVVVYNTTLTSIQPDGHGGTLVGNIDFHNVTLSPSRVSFLAVPEQLSAQTNLIPLATLGA